MSDAYDRLLDARERGLSFYNGQGNLGRGGGSRTSDYHGFELSGLAVSTGRGVIGHISVELWYWTLKRYKSTIKYLVGSGEERVRIGEYMNTSGNAGMSVKRVVTKPEIDKKSLINILQIHNTERILVNINYYKFGG